MKKVFFLIFSMAFFCNSNQLIAQDSQNYLNIIAKSLSEEYLKSNTNLFFTIQVGAFINKNKTLETTKHIIITKESDNLFKYRLGEFTTYEEAVSFKKIVLSVCPDAFIVPIKNGKRIHIKEALKELVHIL